MYIDITSSVNSNNEKNGNFVKRKSSAVLPELNSRIDCVKDHLDWNVTDSTQNTCLPILGKQNSVQALNKQQLDDGCKLLSIIFFMSNNSFRFIYIDYIHHSSNHKFKSKIYFHVCFRRAK